MNHTSLFVVFLALIGRVYAGEQLITVTPQSIESWSVVGADKTLLAQKSLLTLPAKAQLSGRFFGNLAILHLVSRPTYGSEPSEWPIIEVGPAALAIVQKDGLGKLVLVVGENKQIDLPWTIADNTSSLELMLAYDQATGSGAVCLGDQYQYFEGTPSSGPLEVILTNGNKGDWQQDNMEVLLLTAESDQPVSAGMKSTQAKKDGAKETLKSALDKLLSRTGETGGHMTGAGSIAPNSQDTHVTPLLKVLTPPAVRRGKAELVRTAISQKAQH